MSVLDIVLPGLLGPFSSNLPTYISDELKQAEFKKLNTWLSRAQISPCKADSYYSTLQSLIYPQCNLSVCQLTAKFDKLENTPENLYRIDPVHFKAESDHAVLLGGHLLDIAIAEAEALISAFNSHFAEDAISLHMGAADRWYLQTEKPLELSFNAIDYSLGRDIKHFMPEGGDALWWRKILNEAQMLFFQHPVNQHREENRLLTINGLWLWDGCYESSDDSLLDYQNIFTNDVFASALAVQSEAVIARIDEVYKSPKKMLSGRNLLVIDDLYEAVCYGDIDAWFKSLSIFCEMHFDKIYGLLTSKKVLGVNIYPCDGRVFYVDRWQLLKFWKMVQTLDAHVMAGSN